MSFPYPVTSKFLIHKKKLSGQFSDTENRSAIEPETGILQKLISLQPLFYFIIFISIPTVFQAESPSGSPICSHISIAASFAVFVCFPYFSYSFFRCFRLFPYFYFSCFQPLLTPVCLSALFLKPVISFIYEYFWKRFVIFLTSFVFLLFCIYLFFQNLTRRVLFLPSFDTFYDLSGCRLPQSIFLQLCPVHFQKLLCMLVISSGLFCCNLYVFLVNHAIQSRLHP